MKTCKYLLFTLLVLLYGSLAIAQSAATPAGRWTTIDDKSGQKRAVIDIKIHGDMLDGTIVEVFPAPGDTGICQNCSGEFKNKPVKGLQFLWGLHQDGQGVWDGGHILDPKNGKIYRAKLSMKGDRLYVRGYIGLSMLGRTQIWVR